MSESTEAARAVTRHAYGDDPSQYGELHLPSGTPHGVVVVVHGGFWKAQYDADALGTPLARSLAGHGWAAWNLEYRRVGTGPGGGGGAPETFDDVAAGIDLLATLDLDTSTVVTLGHSAGGHLAAWAAARGRYGWADEVPVTHVISQAGVLDLAPERSSAGARPPRCSVTRRRRLTSASTPRSRCRSPYPSGACTRGTTRTCRSSSPRRTSRERPPPARTPP